MRHTKKWENEIHTQEKNKQVTENVCKGARCLTQQTAFKATINIF